MRLAKASEKAGFQKPRKKQAFKIHQKRGPQICPENRAANAGGVQALAARYLQNVTPTNRS